MLKAVILAAGKGTRMKSDLPKVVHNALGKPLVYYAMKAAKEAGAKEICAVVGYGADLVKEAVKKAAEDVGVSIEWGGDWSKFKDGPHYQLPWSKYPK